DFVQSIAMCDFAQYPQCEHLKISRYSSFIDAPRRPPARPENNKGPVRRRGLRRKTWQVRDSNPRMLSSLIYSQIPLAAWVTCPAPPTTCIHLTEGATYRITGLRTVGAHTASARRRRTGRRNAVRNRISGGTRAE